MGFPISLPRCETEGKREGRGLNAVSSETSKRKSDYYLLALTFRSLIHLS